MSNRLFLLMFFSPTFSPDVKRNLNIIKATSRPKLFEKLEDLEYQLNLCEKALADYLETKRLIYPRFYFISSADLLDILSNG